MVFSRSFEEHLNHVSEVFRCLEAAGFQLRKYKCMIAYQGVEFLGRPEIVKELQRKQDRFC